ncbi:unnamed protein product (macronuclear) [Paramecium tetraurelia]|uniref:NADH dehydrogenase [ubiquinone] 1 beta subcomplex subunit 11, mitochondrial n=1 Tax=Paramecium tetraurelia TaxID=5888 RepID=A0EH58_PARTE|nr:uncharacterized protein GSPATT00026973001 [Paramecium tetraurelia]CAK94649.1 unnamed protein product [Paramecium tetraurelia]|eukprot:XP_001462022.1 hypothetical protein (macronuclear) [Paramecium tetraurelia strain d4-2]
MNFIQRAAYRYGQSNLSKLEQIGLSHTKSINLSRPPRNFTPGQQAPIAYTEQFTYPEDYRPWTINYKKDGIFWLVMGISWFAYFSYELAYLRRTEQEERPNKEYYAS